MAKSHDKPEPIDLSTRATLRLDETASALGVSEGHVRNHLSELPVFRFGTVPLVCVELLREWARNEVESQSAETAAAAKSIIEALKPRP